MAESEPTLLPNQCMVGLLFWLSGELSPDLAPQAMRGLANTSQ